MQITEEIVKYKLIGLLNECLESKNQEYSFEVKSIDLKNRKINIDFDITIIEEDNYIGFQGY